MSGGPCGEVKDAGGEMVVAPFRPGGGGIEALLMEPEIFGDTLCGPFGDAWRKEVLVWPCWLILGSHARFQRSNLKSDELLSTLDIFLSYISSLSIKTLQ
jgi:hypothetical protein